MYATGTRTVRGMEAITLSVPPSPGRSIVKRKNNRSLYNIGDVFKEKGYSRTFFYGGDGYFDNMNNFFGSNGFDIVDRGRGYLFGESFTAKRTNIKDEDIQFENAWGVCDEDIYKQVIKEADLNYAANKPFFNFIMTTSNHRPYTYPENKIDIPSGTGRDGAVKYNLPNAPKTKIVKQASQIDFFPTLFGYLGWEYRSNFYGKDINTIEVADQRAFIGNYRKLGLLKADKLSILGDQNKSYFYKYDQQTNSLEPETESAMALEEIISYYQTNDYRYQNGLMEKKIKNNHK